MNQTAEIKFRIEPINEDYDPNDDRWLSQINQLVLDLEEGVGRVNKEANPTVGQKGALEFLSIVLGSKDLIAGAVDMFKDWISRDQKRELVISVERDDKIEKITVSGSRMDKADIRAFMESALKN